MLSDVRYLGAQNIFGAELPWGGGNDTPSLRVPAARIFKELPCFGVKFSNIHPASESGFLPGTFWGIYCYANFLCYANFSIVFYCFLLFSNQLFLGGGANCLREKPAVSRTMYQNTEKSCFQRKP